MRAFRQVFVSIFALLLVGATASAQDNDDACFLCSEAAAFIDEYSLRESATPIRDRKDWAPPKRIVHMYSQGFSDVLSRIAPDAEIVAAGSLDAVGDLIAGADIYIGTCNAEIAKHGTSLKWIQIGRAGIDSCANQPDIVDSDILVTNMQRIFGKPIAEHAIGLMFAFSRKLYVYDDQQRDEKWARDILNDSEVIPEGLWEIKGKTMLVAGLGGIGTEVARRADALGMRVLATRNSRREGPDFVEYVGLAHELNELAAQADVVVSVLPLTADTEKVHDAAFFKAMKPEAIFINIGRGETVDTDALVAALQSGDIGGAGLDVAYPEPLPAGHPLWKMPNVIMTPHVANSSDQTIRRFGLLAIENLRRYIAGDALLNEVDLERGY